MNCPACSEPMIVLELSEVEIDHCISCGGIWLDAGELELLLGDSPQKDSFMSSFTVGSSAGEKGRKCPICFRRMGKVLCGKDKKVLVDRCRSNDGIWLDVGELDEILESGGSGPSNKVLELLGEMFGKGERC